jgi:hypothetical protein
MNLSYQFAPGAAGYGDRIYILARWGKDYNALQPLVKSLNGTCMWGGADALMPWNARGWYYYGQSWEFPKGELTEVSLITQLGAIGFKLEKVPGYLDDLAIQYEGI